MAKQDSRGNQLSGLLFVGCIIIGTAIGMLLDQVAVGSMLGVGVGFIAMGVSRAFIK